MAISDFLNTESRLADSIDLFVDENCYITHETGLGLGKSCKSAGIKQHGVKRCNKMKFAPTFLLPSKANQDVVT